eukprot:5761526-Amphidinium_carterae.1
MVSWAKVVGSEELGPRQVPIKGRPFKVSASMHIGTKQTMNQSVLSVLWSGELQGRRLRPTLEENYSGN